MGETDANFNVEAFEGNNFMTLIASGTYSLERAIHLCKLSIDTCLLYNKKKILVDITKVTGNVPFFDRFQYAEALAQYKSKHALTAVSKIALFGNEPLIDKNRFGETVAVNRGVNIKVFTELNDALAWLNEV
ncbi:MAG TPA: STAS/SEC14 domain-containing protein [Lacibacter sp.]|nr:STAS/SEC14 domain-containing protein [Lacibacter sp.]